jgi:hypothetical protein
VVQQVQRSQRGRAGEGRRTASGYLSPPSDHKAFNFAAIDFDTVPPAVHARRRDFRPAGVRPRVNWRLSDRYSWEESLPRCLHVCFPRRSSLDPPDAAGHGRLSPDRLAASSGPARARLSTGCAPLRAVPVEGREVPPGRPVTKDAAPFFMTSVSVTLPRTRVGGTRRRAFAPRAERS